ncbi:nuclease-related domain-containing protein [Paenibacillus sp. 1A_MP2]|uniref:nuclease-related domain-containing protein n=1 Tax=Paenibacillus sp. 1A_MP2 TaxID=3457495 RepID=UPI003FCCFC2C
MFKKILSLFKSQPELANQITASASSLPSTAPIPTRMVRSRRKAKSDGDWTRQPEEPTTAQQLHGLPGEYKVLNDLLVANTKSRSGYSSIDHVVIGPRGSL